MFDLGELFQWERFITPSIIKVFYWLAILLAILVGASGVLTGLTQMFLNPIAGLLMVIGSVFGVLISILAARIVAEFVLITFRAGEAIPDALTRLWKDVLPRIDLAPLRIEDVTAVLEASLDAPELRIVAAQDRLDPPVPLFAARRIR